MSKTVPFQTIQFNISMLFNIKIISISSYSVCKTVLIETIQISISMKFIFIQAIDRALSGATILDQSRPRSDGNNGVLHIYLSPSITWTSPPDCLVSYTGHFLGMILAPAEVQSVYSSAPADRAI